MTMHCNYCILDGGLTSAAAACVGNRWYVSPSPFCDEPPDGAISRDAARDVIFDE
jgi:hypothetical protein